MENFCKIDMVVDDAVPEGEDPEEGLEKTKKSKKRRKRVHKPEVSYPCPYVNCTSKFNRPYRLKLHLLSHENKKLFQCKEEGCNKSYSNNSHLIRHVNVKHKVDETKYTLSERCPQCFKRYANRQNLKRHIYIAHENAKYVCNICNQNFSRKRMLVAHSYFHTGVKAFSCGVCLKSFHTNYELSRHARFHKAHKCEHCDKVFNYAALFKLHKKEHLPTEYICDYCQESFSVRNDIINHLKKHDASSIFICPFNGCPRSYSYKRNLNQHISLIHENKTFDCHLCGAKLSTKAKLQYHVVNHYEVARSIKKHGVKRKTRKDKGTFKKSTASVLSGLQTLPDENNTSI